MALIAWWPLNGDLNDYSGNGYTLTNTGAAIDQAGKIGQCYLLNGSSSFLNSNLNIPTRTFSVSLWVKILKVENKVIFGSWNKYGLKMYNSKFTVVSWYNDENTSADVPLNTWVHATVVYNLEKNVKKLYLNGTEANSSYFETSRWSGERTFCLGKYNENTMEQYPNIMLNDVRIYDHALEPHEVKELARTKILHWNFNECGEPTENLADFQCRIANSGTSLIENLPYEFMITVKQTSMVFTNIYYSHTKLVEGRTYTLTFYGSDIQYFSSFGGGNSCVPSTAVNVNHIKDNKISITFTFSPCIYVFIGYANSSKVKIDQIINLKYQIEEKAYGTEYTHGIREGKVYDSSGFGNHGAISAATSPRWTDRSRFGSGCYDFLDNELRSVKYDNFPLDFSQELTISMWILKRDSTVSRRLFQFQNVDGTGFNNSATWIEQRTNGGLMLCYIYGSTNIVNTNPLETNVFNHVVAKYNNEKISIYINGVLQSTKDIPGSSSLRYNFFTLGSLRGLNGTHQFNGLIDDVRFYATALSDTDIERMYRAGITAGVFKAQRINETAVTHPVSDTEYWNRAKVVTGGAGYVSGITNTYDSAEKALKVMSYSYAHHGSSFYQPLKVGVRYRFTADVKSVANFYDGFNRRLTLFKDNKAILSNYPPVVHKTDFNTSSGMSGYKSCIYEFTVDIADLKAKGKQDATHFTIQFCGYGSGQSEIYMKNMKLEIMDETRPRLDNKYELNCGEISEMNAYGIPARYPLHIKEMHGATWLKVFRHKTIGTSPLFGSDIAEALETNTADYNAQKYSLLKYVNGLKKANGKIEFLLKYNENSWSSDYEYNRWEQDYLETAAPNHVSGYSPIKLSWTSNSFGGLCRSIGYGGSTHFDCSPANETWYYAIGSKASHNGGFPGPNDTTNNFVELWVKIEKPHLLDTFSPLSRNGTVHMKEFIEAY